MLNKFGWTAVGIIIVLVISAGIVGIKMSQFKAMGDAAAEMVIPPETVNVVKVHEENWHPRVSSVGSVAAIQGTIISTETDGIVREIVFEAGKAVAAGERLVELDAEIERAQLRSAQVSEKLAEVSFERAKSLITSKTISQSEYDLSRANLEQARAQVDNLRAVIARKTVRAPFSGELGIRQISIGEYLEKGSPVVSLQSLNRVYIEFSLPQKHLGNLVEGLEIRASVDAYPDREFVGTVTAINPDVDQVTRNIRVQATLDNPDHSLRPGMFVSVEMILAREEKRLFIPVTAVLHAAFGDSVFVVEEKQTGSGVEKALFVQQKFVRLGERRGDFVTVLEGLNAGETVVSAGVFKLRSGMQVVIDTTLAPEFSFAPTPKNT